MKLIKAKKVGVDTRYPSLYVEVQFEKRIYKGRIV